MRRVQSLKLLGVMLCALATLLLTYPIGAEVPVVPSLVPDPVQAAWRRVQESGVYRFSTTIVETTHPAPTLANVGRSSRETRAYLEGRTNLPEDVLQLRIWQNGGSVMETDDGLELRIEGDRAQGRAIGGVWEEIDADAAAFAPGNDAVAYLVGARNVRQAASPRYPAEDGRPSGDVPAVTRYAFDLNGPAVAGYMRDQLEDYLRAKGELPSGLYLSTPDPFQKAIGDGEVWIDGEGLPLRLTVHIEYPQQQDGQRLEAEIQTDFSGFDRGSVVAEGSPLRRISHALGLTRALRQARGLREQAGLALVTVALLGLLVVKRRSKAAYATFVVIIVGALVLTPILQGHHVQAFSQDIASKRAKQELQLENQREAERAHEALSSSTWDPQAGALQLTNSQPADLQLTAVQPAERTPAHGEAASAKGEPDPESDDDGDGLSYDQEMRLGTDPDEKDSDGDQITDDVEIAGFWYAGRRWYLNPLDPDTNNDGEPDGMECPEQVRENEESLSPQGRVCANTDVASEPTGHQVPDALDRDNDGDGVPDRVDLSPYTAVGEDGEAFDYDNPLLLQVDELEADKPVFVDFQLRPRDESHLWYAINVLDWPSGDERAQIQRRSGNDSTFADVAQEGEILLPNSDNGDVRLVPMLEIEIPFKAGHYGNLPVKEGAPLTRTSEITVGQWLDSSKLIPYGISVREKDNDGDLLAYVPLNLVQDETGGDRVAFAARMHYWPSIPNDEVTTGVARADWGLTQKVRMVWLVQMLTDSQGEDGVWTLDQLQMVRAYPEEWNLTGLSVREDHGLDVAITYEDPGSDNDLRYDDPLWMVASGLEASFIAGRDQDDDGARDVTIDEIDARFSLTTTASITARFGISPVLKLETETFSYDHQDFMAHVMMTETQQILSTTFTPYVNQGADGVTLLLSQEGRARTANLDGKGNTVTIDGHQLTLNLDPEDTPVKTSARLNWGPFRHEDGEWQTHPIAEYIDRLEVRLRDVFDEYQDEPNYEEILLGQLTVARAYYVALYRGLERLVQWDQVPIGPIGQIQTDSDLARRLSGEWIPQGGGWISVQGGTLAITIYKIGDLYNRLRESFAKFEARRANLGTIYARIGKWARFKIRPLAGWKAAAWSMKATGAVILAATAIALFASVFLQGSEAMDVVLKTLTTAGKVVSLAATVFGITAEGIMKSYRDGLKDLKKGVGVKSTVVFVILYLSVTWGVFFYQLAASGADAGSLAANAAFFGMAAQALTLIVLVAISLIPVFGAILSALIWLIDSIAMWACKALDSENWFCEQQGIQGLMTTAITWWLYSATVMVTVDDDSRLAITEFEQAFLDPDKGLTVGNSLVVSTTMENQLDLVDYLDLDWKAQNYFWQYSDRTLASSTFRYELRDGKKDIQAGLDRFDIFNDWSTGDGRPFTLIARSNTTVPLEEAGINETVELYLAEGNAIPVQECFSILFIPVCYVRTERDTNHVNLGKSMYYDVFPATFSAFYSLGEQDGGYTLAWSLDSDPPFPRLKDADGDGLRNPLDGGADPDDRDWDTDGDGLSDFFEVQQGTDPEDPDSDEDGLDDREEVIHRTNPLRTDSDYDGLTDQEELDGWEFVYDFAADGTQLRTWVTSDPLSKDADVDELTDFQERTFGFHPGVPSDPQVLTLEASAREENAPVLLLRLDEMENATAFRDDSGYANNGTCQGDGCPAAGHYGQYGNAPHFDGADDSVIADSVSSHLTGGAVSFGGWVHPDGGMTADGAVLGFGTAAGGTLFSIGFDPTDDRFYFEGPFARAETGPYAPDTWHHVFAVIEADGSGRLYVGGASEATFTTTAQPATDGRFSIGQAWEAGVAAHYFLGSVDEVLIFDRALAQGELEELILGHYNTADAVVAPRDPLTYRASVKNELFNRYAQGLLSVDFPVAAPEVPPEDFILNPQEETVLTGTVTVAETAPTGVYSLTQEVDAMITDWREASDYAELLYHFSETMLPFQDSSGSQPPRDGQCDGVSCPTSTTGRYGNGLWFDGTDDFVYNDDVAAYLSGDALTLGAWISPTHQNERVGDVLGMVGSNGLVESSFGVRGLVGGDVEFYYSDRCEQDGSRRWVYGDRTFAADRWYHVMLVLDDLVDCRGTLYVNGEKEITFEKEPYSEGRVHLDADHAFDIGGHGFESAYRAFEGKIDEVVLFNETLSADRVKAYYNAPVFDLPLDESAGADRFADESGFGNEAVCDAVAGHCPEAGEGGISSDSEAAGFAGDDALSVDGSGILDLYGSDFTLSAWVFPIGGPEDGDCHYRAEYFNIPDVGPIEFVFDRCEDWPIDHPWGTGGPGGGVHEDDFMVRWTGDFAFEEGEYLFRMATDGSYEVTLDGDAIMNTASERGAATVYVDEGVHRVFVQYWHDTGDAYVTFDWSPAPAFHPQGILGADGTTPEGTYPTIERVDFDELRVGFVAPTGDVVQATTDGDVLRPHRWNHVVATYDGQYYEVYVNGQEAGEALAEPGDTPASNAAFEIGRAGDHASFRLEHLEVLEQTDAVEGSGVNCDDHAGEYVIERRVPEGSWELLWRGERLSDKKSAEARPWCLDYQVDIGVTRAFTDHALIRVFEEDEGESHARGDGNDVGVNDPMGSYRFDTDDSGTEDHVRRFRSDRGDGWVDEVAVTWDYTNTAPFRGRIDQVAIYRRAMDTDQVAALYDMGTTVLRMSLDDPPGATDFVDALGQAEGTCTGMQCPTVGVPGRENFALRFDGGADGAGDTVELTDANVDELQELTVAAWVKPLSLPPGQIMRFVTLGNEKAVLRYDDAWSPGSQDLHFYMSVGSGLHHVRVAHGLQTGVWHHVAGTYDGLNMNLYLDGSLAATETVTGSVGGGDTVLLSHPTETLDGVLDEVVIARRALSADDVSRLYESTPELLLHLDETEGATGFTDESGNGHDGFCADARCPDAGVKGQLGLAASFDGVDDKIEVAASDDLNPGEALTLAAWVKLTDADVDQKIAGRTSWDAARGYVMGVRGGRIYPEIWDADGTRTSAECGQISAGYWTHLAVTWESGGHLVAYVNGEVACRVPATMAAIGATGDPLRVGVAPWDGASFPANGRVDHVTLYRRALSPREMRDLFRLQAKWVEERRSVSITVDADPPSSTLVSSDTYRLNQDAVLLVSARDDTSLVTMVELGVSTDGGTTTTWESAPRCQDAARDAAWCPTFVPTVGEGRYLLKTRATDAVGNLEAPSRSYVFLVDDTSPDPATAIQDGALIQATRTPTDTWLVPLSGTVSDSPILGTSEPGSGATSVDVRLTATAHPTDTMIPWAAELSGGSWELDVPLPFADASGWYTLSVQPRDGVGNVAAFVDLATVGLDTAAPEVSLDPVPTSLTDTITTTLTLTGLVTETGAVNSGISRLEIGVLPAELTYVPTDTVAAYRFDEPAGATAFADVSDNELTADCMGVACPTAGHDGAVNQAVHFDGGDLLVITQGEGFSDLLPEREMSVVAWVKVSSYATPEGYVSAIQRDGGFERGWALGQVDEGGRQFFFALSTQGADDGDGVLTYLKSSGLGPHPGEWHHVAATYDGATMRLYVDGELKAVDETSQSGDINYPASGWFALGALKDDDETHGHHGYLDEVAVLDRVLTAGQVRALAGAGGGIVGEDVLGWDDATLANSGDGVTSTGWSYPLPAAFDGIYEINLRPADVFDNVAAEPDWDSGWVGEIDTLAPRVAVTAEEEITHLGIRTTYTCWAQDFNLIWTSEDHPEYDFDCPCQRVAPQATVYTPTYYHEASLWYHDVLTDTNRLYELEAACTVLGPALVDATLEAYDVHGRHAITMAQSSQTDFLQLVDSGVLTPSLHAVITSTAPYTLEGRGYAQDHLASITVSVDGSPIDTHTWSTPGVTETQWGSLWPAPTEGIHVLNSHAVDQGGVHQPVDRPVEVIVDVSPPWVDISPTVLTTTHRLSQGRVVLSGHVGDANGVSGVEVSIESGTWQEASYDGGVWQLDWYLDGEPAGESYSVSARAIDVAGHTAQVTEVVTVDLERPNPITLTLTADDVDVPPGTILDSLPAALNLSWEERTARTDLTYDAIWSVYDPDRTDYQGTVLETPPGSGHFSSQYVGAEAQRIRPRVVSRFADGNQQVDIYGSIYVDTPTTPDYVTLTPAMGDRRPYLGWMESGCSEMGVDRRVQRSAPASAAVDDQQAFYATWNPEALRLAWTGANWDRAGDLFIYLDTALGGALQAYNPLTDTTGVSVELPGDVGFAEFLIWVEDSQTAHLMSWNPGALDWDTERLSPEHYRFEEGLYEGHTDLYLPFDMLGISSPAMNSLGLVALAIEEPSTSAGEGIRIWSTMPPANPINSARAVETLDFAPGSYSLGLTQAYFWPTLGPGICPNAAYGDSDVQVDLFAEPLGSTYGLLSGDLFWLGKDLITETRAADVSQRFTFMDTDHLPLGDGDTITYTIDYVNRGTETASDVTLQATALYALSFSGAVSRTISVGDVAPGASGQVTFQAQVDATTNYNACLDVSSPEQCEPFRDWAILEALVIDQVHSVVNPIDWLWADHPVDTEPPTFLDIEQPERFVSLGENTLSGYAYDASGVPALALELQGTGHQTACTDSAPTDGRWSCRWNATTASGGVPMDGDQLDLRLQVVDDHGQPSAWTDWRTFVVDAVPPTVTFSAETTAAYSDTVVSDDRVTFRGAIEDVRGVADVAVCLKAEGREPSCGPASVQASGQVSSSALYTDAEAAAIDGTTACGGGEIVRTFNVAEDFSVGEVRLGFNAVHARRDDILVTLTSPGSTSVQVLGPGEGTATDYQNYDVLLYDAAPAGLHAFRDNDDADDPLFGREARPYAPLRAFRGEPSAGVWTLTICDDEPLSHHGIYSQTQLFLRPGDTAARIGNWSYTHSAFDELDGVTHTATAYGTDLAGNQTEAISLTFEIDNVAPSVTVAETTAITVTTPNRAPLRVLAGTATDGGRLVQMYAFVRTPRGDLWSRQIGRGEADGSWWFDLEPEETGQYTIWVNAVDAGGNTSQAGSFDVRVVGGPIADAGRDQTVRSGDLVTLDGSGSEDPDRDPLTFRWSQTGGPIVALSNPRAVAPTFTAPWTSGSLTFTLKVTDTTALTDTDTAVVDVTPGADLVLTKTVLPAGLAIPGESVSYTLAFRNQGLVEATNVVISDSLPLSVTQSSVLSSGVVITETAPGYAWAVEDLGVGEGGIITITGVLSSSLPAGHVFTNTATIASSAAEGPLENNVASAGVRMTFPQDVSRDCEVDVGDIMVVVGRWRCGSGDACYDSLYDLDGDGLVTIVDIMQVAAHWGDTCE